MRFLVIASLLVAACDHAPANPYADGGPAVDYPAGPYGTQPGAIIEDLTLSAKNYSCDPTVQFYDQLRLEQLPLNTYYRDGSVTFLLLTTVAGWCDACNNEQPQMKPLLTKYRALGLRIMEVMMQGYNSVTADAATETDVNHWATVNSLTVGLALDSSGKMANYVDLSASPSMNILIRVSDMRIVHMAAGEEALEPVIANFLP